MYRALPRRLLRCDHVVEEWSGSDLCGQNPCPGAVTGEREADTYKPTEKCNDPNCAWVYEGSDVSSGSDH